MNVSNPRRKMEETHDAIVVMKNIQGTLPTERSFVIEYPGIVENETAALKTFGGEQKILQNEKDDKPLQLTWPSKNPIARRLSSKKNAFSGLLLKVSESGDAEMVSVVESCYSFTELSDFAITPSELPKDDSARMGSLVSTAGRAFESLVTTEPYFKSEPLLAISPMLSRIKTPTDLVMKGKKVNSHDVAGALLTNMV